jgi:hypothetical protein
LRAPDGAFTTFDAPGAGSGTGTYQGTFPISMNPAGAIAGQYIDANNEYHGFLRAPNGGIAFFDALRAGTGAFQGTLPNNINSTDEIAGWYFDANSVDHGFMRAQNGHITRFNVAGAGTGAYQGTVAISNNPAGEVIGWTSSSSGRNFKGCIAAGACRRGLSTGRPLYLFLQVEVANQAVQIVRMNAE